jgi:hypothetical protein
MQEFTTAESAAIHTLAGLVGGVCIMTVGHDLPADKCARLSEMLTNAPPIPTLSLGVQEPRVVAILAVFAEVFRYFQHEVTEGSRDGGLSHNRTRLVNGIANLFIHLPSLVGLAPFEILKSNVSRIAKVFPEPFDEHQFVRYMRGFDQRAGTRCEAIYQTTLHSQLHHSIGGSSQTQAVHSNVERPLS